jgi:hypothetical protein
MHLPGCFPRLFVQSTRLWPIVEFGSMSLRSGKWELLTYTGKSFSPNDFAEWYSCPGATLIPGETYTDPSNWMGSSQLKVTHRSKWYFIAQTIQGDLVKGEAEEIYLAELEPDI